MNSRDRLSEGELKNQIEKKLEELLSNHPGLKALREKRRREEIQSKLADSKPLKEVLEDILKKSPALSALLIPGYKIKTPFDLRNVAEQEEYVGKTFPTYFRIMLKRIKECPLNRTCRVQFETDATNDYFERSTLPGDFTLLVNNEETADYILNLWNGIATLTITLPDNAKAGNILSYKSIANDSTQFRPFENEFQIEVLEACITKRKGVTGERKKPPSKKEGDERAISSQLALPSVVEIRRDRWADFGFDENSALEARDTGQGDYDFFVNMDNIYLLSEVKARSDIDARLLGDRYKYALVLIGLALLKEHSDDNGKTKDEEIQSEVSNTTAKLSPILLPMISYLGDLEPES